MPGNPVRVFNQHHRRVTPMGAIADPLGGTTAVSNLMRLTLKKFRPSQRMGKVVEEYSALEATEEKIMYAAIH